MNLRTGKDNPMVKHLEGGCQCGRLRYEVSEPALALYACHCSECRRQSGSAHGLTLTVPRAALHFRCGTPRTWSRPTESGSKLDCLFCDDCGTRVVHLRVSAPATAGIKAGTLDEPVDLAQAIHIWTSRALPGALIPADRPSYPKEPSN